MVTRLRKVPSGLPTAISSSLGLPDTVQFVSRPIRHRRCLNLKSADLGADLLVMGAYGHSRAREQLLGGATRALLRSMTIPVLMSH
jgi:nucleotide-binding universal stress UspA family protein